MSRKQLKAWQQRITAAQRQLDKRQRRLDTEQGRLNDRQERLLAKRDALYPDEARNRLNANAITQMALKIMHQKLDFISGTQEAPPIGTLLRIRLPTA